MILASLSISTTTAIDSLVHRPIPSFPILHVEKLYSVCNVRFKVERGSGGRDYYH